MKKDIWDMSDEELKKYNFDIPYGSGMGWIGIVLLLMLITFLILNLFCKG